ncbi:MAG: type III-B CRISPR module RAMP protein Cmr6 [Parvularcula sp.]
MSHLGPDGNRATPSPTPKSHAGLVYQKIGAPWSGVEALDERTKSRWMRDTAKAANNPDVPRERFRAMVKAAHGNGRGDYFEQSLSQPLAIGLGIENPVQIGCLWHPTLGLPYIPGSSLKGVARAFVEEWIAAGDEEILAEIDRLFGPSKIDEDTDGAAGSLIFHDALPIPNGTGGIVLIDTMTPHHRDYHTVTDPDRKPWPGDWESPTIIPFLTVKKGTRFAFGVGLRPGADEDDLKTGVIWLQQGLEYLGAGAKTSRGYGRFDPSDTPER